MAAPPETPAIVIEDLRKNYGPVEVLKGVSLSIRRGDFATILGPSGSGKTTILRCLAGLEEPDHGRIWLNDKLVFDAARGVNLPSRHRRIGMIFQNYALWPHMTVLRHVTFPLLRQGVAGAEAIARTALRTVGLEGHADRFPHELSGGQQQRVAVARAIVGGPGVLLMDEPLSNLDVQLRLQLRDELKIAHESAKATSVFVTHDQGEAFALSDHLVLMHEGRIVQEGTPASLRRQPATRFVAGFLGIENIWRGEEWAAILTDPQGGPVALDATRSHALAATDLRDTPPADPAGWVTIPGAERLSATYDSLIHTAVFRAGGRRLVAKSLAPFAANAAQDRLWLRLADLIPVSQD